jgi:hypothetical protein
MQLHAVLAIFAAAGVRLYMCGPIYSSFEFVILHINKSMAV